MNECSPHLNAETSAEQRIVALVQQALTECPGELIDASGTPRVAGRNLLDALLEQARREVDAAGGSRAAD